MLEVEWHLALDLAMIGSWTKQWNQYPELRAQPIAANWIVRFEYSTCCLKRKKRGKKRKGGRRNHRGGSFFFGKESLDSTE